MRHASTQSRRAFVKGLGCTALVLTLLPADIASCAGSKVLVLYFSHTGNTKKLATMIHERAGGEILELKTVHPYPQKHDTVVDLAKKEQERGDRPALATVLPNLKDFDTIFLGFPNWWGTMPMALFTMLENNDFSGKTIIPFCTHGGSRLGRSVEDIKKLCPKARVLKGFAAFGTRVDAAKEEVEAWLYGLGIEKGK